MPAVWRREIDGVYAFWPTAQEAGWFYDSWKDKQGATPKPKECGCGELRQRIAELEAALKRIKRPAYAKGGSMILIVQEYEAIASEALTQGEEK